MRRLRTVTVVLPTETGTYQGLAYTLWLPAGDRPPSAGVLIHHGAGSCKEAHHGFARALVSTGMAALAFDARGHGASEGPMDGRAIDDVAAMAGLLRGRIGGAPIGLRGSSMGGYMAVVAAPAARARSVVSICPAPGELLRRGLAAGRFDFAVDAPRLDGLLAEHDLTAATAALDVPLLLLHAEGDERVPVESSRELAGALRHPQSRLITVPGGHHRSIQSDPELQAVSLRFLARTLASARPGQ